MGEENTSVKQRSAAYPAATMESCRDILNAINDRLLDSLAMFLFENKDNLRALRGSRILTKVTKDGFSFAFD